MDNINGFTIQNQYQFQDFIIYEITSSLDSDVYFFMNADQVSIGTYYDGSMTIIDAANSTIIGMILTGWMNNPLLDIEKSWYKCHVTQEMNNWLCVHSDTYTKCEITGKGTPSATVNGISFWVS